MRASSRNREAASQTRVEYAEAARAYVVYINATPLLGKDGNVVTYTREQIQKWYADEHQRMIDGMVKNHAAPGVCKPKGPPAPAPPARAATNSIAIAAVRPSAPQSARTTPRWPVTDGAAARA